MVTKIHLKYTVVFTLSYTALICMNPYTAQSSTKTICMHVHMQGFRSYLSELVSQLCPSDLPLRRFDTKSFTIYSMNVHFLHYRLHSIKSMLCDSDECGWNVSRYMHSCISVNCEQTIKNVFACALWDKCELMLIKRLINLTAFSFLLAVSQCWTATPFDVLIHLSEGVFFSNEYLFFQPWVFPQAFSIFHQVDIWLQQHFYVSLEVQISTLQVVN